MIDKTRQVIGIAFLVLLLVSALAFVLRPLIALRGEDKPQVAVEAAPAPEVKHEEKTPVPVAGGTVRSYKPAVKRKLNLPESVQKDDAQVVVASSRVKADERPVTVTAVTNTATGETTQYVKEEPLPWIAVNAKSEIGVFGGLKGGEQAIRIMARQELLQVKALHVGAIADLDVMRGGHDSFVGIGVWARW